MGKGVLVIVIGVQKTGKTELCNALLQHMPDAAYISDERPFPFVGQNHFDDRYHCLDTLLDHATQLASAGTTVLLEVTDVFGSFLKQTVAYLAEYKENEKVAVLTVQLYAHPTELLERCEGNNGSVWRALVSLACAFKGSTVRTPHTLDVWKRTDLSASIETQKHNFPEEIIAVWQFLQTVFPFTDGIVYVEPRESCDFVANTSKMSPTDISKIIVDRISYAVASHAPSLTTCLVDTHLDDSVREWDSKLDVGGDGTHVKLTKTMLGGLAEYLLDLESPKVPV